MKPSERLRESKFIWDFGFRISDFGFFTTQGISEAQSNPKSTITNPTLIYG